MPPQQHFDLRHAAPRVLVSVLLGLSQGLGQWLVNNNLPAIQGSLGATAEEAGWLTTAYFATSISAPLLLTKIRFHVGHRIFPTVTLLIFVAVTAVHFLVGDWFSALAARAALGLAQAALVTMSVIYMLDAFPLRMAPFSVVLGFAMLQVGSPLARVISEQLLDHAQWRGLLALDLALAFFSLAAINVVSLSPLPNPKRLSAGDLAVFALFAAGIALIAVVVSQGRVRWWTDTEWLGVCLASAIALIGLYAVIDLNRKVPLLDLRWIAKPFMLRFIFAVLLFRIVLSEQNTGIVGLMSQLGINNDQMHTLFAIATAGVVTGFGVALLAVGHKVDPWLGVLSLALVIVATLMDSRATNLTRPSELYVSQALLAVAIATFFAQSCLIGFGRVLAEGGVNLVTFIAVFATSQNLGGLIGGAWISTFAADLQKAAYSGLTDQLQGSNPRVAARIAQDGLGALAQAATRESYVLAYTELFQWIAAIAAALLIFMGWIGWKTARARKAS